MTLDPIGTVHTCFGGKFGVPRQPGLCPSAWGKLVFHETYRSPEAIRGIEGFSHLWLIFGFHETVAQGWKPTVRPPRLGGNQRVGVFASRSTFRPNGLGLSLVRLEGIDTTANDAPVLLLGGVDLLDGTPVYDIKPYLPYAEPSLTLRRVSPGMRFRASRWKSPTIAKPNSHSLPHTRPGRDPRSPGARSPPGGANR